MIAVSKNISVTYASSFNLEDHNLEVKVCISDDLGYISKAEVRFNRFGSNEGSDGTEKMTFVEKLENKSVFVAKKTLNETGYISFVIHVVINGKDKYITRDYTSFEPVLEEQKLAFWEVFAYEDNYSLPEEIKGGIMYQVFVDTFCRKEKSEVTDKTVSNWNEPRQWKPDEDGEYRSSQFYGGNILGIVSKLDHIKSLGTTALYITPILKSQTNHRYATDDYETVDELVGFWEDLEVLRDECHQRGMILILDIVFNHSGRFNKLIVEHPEMYKWNNGKIQCWWGFNELPEFNQDSPMFQSYVETWIKEHAKYVDGFRVDVADSLQDNVRKLMRKAAPDKYFLYEVWKNAITGDGKKFIDGTEGDAVMNYPFANAIYSYILFGNSGRANKIIRRVYELYPSKAMEGCPIFLSSHDIPHIINILSGILISDRYPENVWDIDKDERWYARGKFDTYEFREWESQHQNIPDSMKEIVFKRLKLALLMEYTLPGLPCIYNGEEMGVTGYRDPFNRTPMPWKEFETEQKNYSVYCMYKALAEFRMKYREIFADSTNFEIVHIDEQMMVYRRKNLEIIINRSNTSVYYPHVSQKVVFGYCQNCADNQISAMSAIVVEI